jgi:hypothetical protein
MKESGLNQLIVQLDLQLQHPAQNLWQQMFQYHAWVIHLQVVLCIAQCHQHLGERLHVKLALLV